MTVLPSLFVSHGAPTFALHPGRAGAQLAELGRLLPRPRAVVLVSPHWMTRGVKVTGALRPETLYDFGGFDPRLRDLVYPAPGDPALAQRIATLLTEAGWTASVDPVRGLDHGAWVPLMHLYPKAEVPVLQVSMPHDLDAQSAHALGQALAPLGAEGVLVLGSGSLTHNLYEFRMDSPKEAAYGAGAACPARAPHARPLPAAGRGLGRRALGHAVHRAGRRHRTRGAGDGVLCVRSGPGPGDSGQLMPAEGALKTQGLASGRVSTP